MAEPGATVYVVDDETDMLKALERLLGAAGYAVQTFPSPEQFLARHDDTAPGCIVLDLALPGLNGLELQQALQAQRSALPIVFLTGRGDIAASVRAMKLGAADFLTKPVDADELIAAVEAALERNRAQRADRADRHLVSSLLAALTTREREVFELIAQGKQNKQIAAECGTVEKTIKFHRANVMRKLGVRTVADLVRLAERAGTGKPRPD
jgi:FixJ family two-component response regulator